MKLKSLVLTALLLNAACSLHAVKLIFKNETGEPKIALCYADCSNEVKEFNDTYTIDDNKTFSLAKIKFKIPGSIPNSGMSQEINIGSYTTDTNFSIKKSGSKLTVTPK